MSTPFSEALTTVATWTAAGLALAWLAPLVGAVVAVALLGKRAERLAIGSGPRLLSVSLAGRTVAFHLIPLGRWYEASEAVDGQGRWRTLGMPCAADLVVIMACWLVLAVGYASWGIPTGELHLRVERVAPGGAASAAGLGVGDRIVAIDRQAFATVADLRQRSATAGASGRPMLLTAERAGGPATLALRPPASGRLGLSTAVHVPRQAAGPVAAAAAASIDCFAAVLYMPATRDWVPRPAGARARDALLQVENLLHDQGLLATCLAQLLCLWSVFNLVLALLAASGIGTGLSAPRQIGTA